MLSSTKACSLGSDPRSVQHSCANIKQPEHRVPIMTTQGTFAVLQISGEVSATGSPYGWHSQGLQDYSTGFAAIFDVLISANRSQEILLMLQDGHYIDEQTASRATTLHYPGVHYVGCTMLCSAAWTGHSSCCCSIRCSSHSCHSRKDSQLFAAGCKVQLLQFSVLLFALAFQNMLVIRKQSTTRT